MQVCASPSPDGIWDGRYGYIDDPLNPLVVYGLPDVAWNATLTAGYAIAKAEKKWTVELAIPFADLGVAAPPEGTRWRGNLGRERHKSVWDATRYRESDDEFFLWSPNLQKVSVLDNSAFGDLYFGKKP